jgi:predicted Asp-tRNA(Asn)/Glu-tRNA(Gln) amidotransferase subunit C
MEKAIDKELIEKQAKEILDKFAKALEKAEKEEGEKETFVEREEFERNQGEGNNYNPDFKKKMLENSPSHDDDFIIGETGGWK